MTVRFKLKGHEFAILKSKSKQVHFNLQILNLKKM